jgi:Uma2 family endonuclease
VSWDTYEQLLAAFAGRRTPRLTYDRGALEIMSPIGNEHEQDAELLGDYAKILADEFGLPIRPGGSFTMKRKDLKRGLEPDRCYWLASVPRIAGIRKIDLDNHPPPDLAIEVDVTSSSLSKFTIFAKLGVVELWRLNGDDLRFYRLGSKRKYTEVPASVSFPGVTPADLMGFLHQARTAGDQIPIYRAFRAWVRQRAANSSPPAP